MSLSRFTNTEYMNWLTVGLAIQVTKKGLEAYIQNAVDKFHQSLLASTTILRNTPSWKSYLTKVHRSTVKTKISWNNSDSSKWFTPGAAWEIAKVFMAPLGARSAHVVSAQTTDLSGLLSILEWSQGPAGVFPRGVQIPTIADARSARNLWAHAPSLQMTNVEKADALKFLNLLLQDPEVFHHKDVQNAVIELINLNKGSLVVVKEKELEIVHQLQRELNQDLLLLRGDVTEWKADVQIDIEQLGGLVKTLSQFINEDQDLLQGLGRKVYELVDELQSTKVLAEETSQEMRSMNARVEKLEVQAYFPLTSGVSSFSSGKSEIHFNSVCDRLKENFVGRSWLFTAVESWIENDVEPRDSRVFLVWGGPGSGKSSWVREMVRRHEGGKLAGYHFCQNDNPKTCDLISLANNLKSMLLTSLSGYADAVQDSSCENDASKFSGCPEKFFDANITTPLQQLPESEKRFVIVDGLDEGGSAIASCFAKLSMKLPSWLRIILTARHDAPALANLFPNCSFESLDNLKSNKQSGQDRSVALEEDMRAFVAQKFENLYKERNNIPAFFAHDKHGTMEQVVRASGNCYLYAKLVIEHIFDGHNQIGLPASLSEIYCLDFRRLFPDHEYFEEKVAPVLELILAQQKIFKTMFDDRYKSSRYLPPNSSSRSVIPLMSILVESIDDFEEAEASGDISLVLESGLLRRYTKRDVNKIFKLLSGYVVRRSRNQQRFFHNSVREWLQDEKSDYYCDVLNGHRIMAQYCEMKLGESRRKLDDVTLEEWSFSSDSDSDLSPCEMVEESSGSLDSDHASSRYSSWGETYFYHGRAKVLIQDYFYHSSYLPRHEENCVQVLLDLGCKAIDLLHLVFCFDGIHNFWFSEYIAMKILDQTDVISKMSLEQKALHLRWAFISKSCEVTAKFVNSGYWLFSPHFVLEFRLQLMMRSGDFPEWFIRFIKKRGSLPHFFFSFMFHTYFYAKEHVEYFVKRGTSPNVCVPQFYRNTLQLDPSVCWNKDVQEYFEKLKTNSVSVITLESLREKPCFEHFVDGYILYTTVDEYTFEKIQKPLSELEHLLKSGECFVSFTYVWHVLLKRVGFSELPRSIDYQINARGYFGETGLMIAAKQRDIQSVKLLLDCGADVNQQDFGGSTALHFASELASSAEPREMFLGFLLAEMLLQRNADPNVRNCWGDSPLSIARTNGNEPLVELSMQYC